MKHLIPCYNDTYYDINACLQFDTSSVPPEKKPLLQVIGECLLKTPDGWFYHISLANWNIEPSIHDKRFFHFPEITAAAST